MDGLVKMISYAVVIVTYNRLALLKECIECVNKQTLPVKKVIVVNNASTDGTKDYLEKIAVDKSYKIINCEENHGGAGGFSTGIEVAVKEQVDWIVVIDDDAMLAADYVERLVEGQITHPQYQAIAGTVVTEGKIDLNHRKRMINPGLLFKNCAIEDYDKEYFTCDNASFCGLMIKRDLIEQIGLPHIEYFIWHDDTEYSIRIRKHTGILVATKAKLNHKTTLIAGTGPRRYTWKDYYGIRNRILYVREHGNLLDKLVNRIDLFAHVVFRNWYFGIIKKDGYDWQYEMDIVKKAVRDNDNMIF